MGSYIRCENGWVRYGLVTDDDEHIEDGVIPCEPDHASLCSSSFGLLRYSDGVFRVPATDKKAILALLEQGYFGCEIRSALRELRTIRANLSDWDIEPDVSKIPNDQAFGTYYYSIDGLQLSDFSFLHIHDVVNKLIESDFFHRTCEDPSCGCDPPEDHPWVRLLDYIRNPGSWSLMWKYKSELLQFEVVRLTDRNAVVPLTVHFDRERPGWFWKKLEEPIFRRLEELTDKIIFRPRKDRPDWIENLKREYGAREIGEAEKVKILKVSLDKVEFPDWPERRSANFSVDLDGVVVYEVTRDSDFLEIANELKDMWSGNARASYILDSLDRWWNLDRSTALVTRDRDGKLVECRLFRHSHGSVCRYFLATRIASSPHSLKAMFGALEWAKAVGYQHSYTFVPKWVYNLNHVREWADSVGLAAEREKEFPSGGEMIELKVDINQTGELLREKIVSAAGNVVQPIETVK